jgi:hypothetical protein
MTEQEYEQAAAELTDEAARLRERLRALEQIIHGKLLPDAAKHLGRIEAIERQIVAIVLRLSEIERDQIDLRIVRATGS